MSEQQRRRINYVGWLGHGNLGDESLQKVIQDAFSAYQLVPVETDWQDHSAVSPVTIVGGSTGIPEWFEGLRPTRYNYIFGAGVKDPRFYGYDYIFRERKKVAVMMKKLDIFRYIGVRGNVSKAILLEQGIESEVIGDPVLSLRPREVGKTEDRQIGISLGSDGILWGMDEERLFSEIAKVCRRLKSDGYELILIPFWTGNVARLRDLAVREGIDLFDSWSNIESTLDLIARCKIFIGEKLHSLAFSAAAGTPFISLEYQPKCYDFAQSVGFERYTLRTDRVTEEKVTKLIGHLLENYEEMKEELARRVNMYRNKQKRFAARIVKDVESLPETYWQNLGFEKRIRNKAFWAADIVLRRRTSLWYAWNRLFFLHFMHYVT